MLIVRLNNLTPNTDLSFGCKFYYNFFSDKKIKKMNGVLMLPPNVAFRIYRDHVERKGDLFIFLVYFIYSMTRTEGYTLHTASISFWEAYAYRNCQPKKVLFEWMLFVLHCRLAKIVNIVIIYPWISSNV